MYCSITLSYSTQDHHLKDGPAHRDLGPLTPNISQETARDPVWWNQMTLACIQWTSSKPAPFSDIYSKVKELFPNDYSSELAQIPSFS